MGTNIKFLSENKIDRNASFVFSDVTANNSVYLYDNNYNNQLISSVATDGDVVTYTISFASGKTGSRIFLASNFKLFNIQYSTNNGSTYGDFSTAISETTNTAEYNYYEFNEVTGVTDLRVQATNTITINDNKKIGQLRFMTELGEVSANPYNMENPYIENSFVHGKSDGGNTYVQFGRKMSMKMRFDDATNDDVTLFRTIKDRFAPVFVYPNGGLSTRTQEPFRVQDMYLVNYINPFHPGLRSGFLIDAGTVIDLELMEV